MTAAAGAWIGMSLCVAAAGGVRGARSATLLHRLTRAYDGSRRGRRLRRRLDAAEVGMSPSTWRLAQVMALLPTLLAVSMFGVGVPGAAAVALSVVRAGGWLLLRLRSSRRSESLEAAVPGLARALAAELGRGITVGDAVVNISASGGGLPAAARELMRRVAASASLGCDTVSAFDECAAAEAAAAARPMRRLAAALVLVQHGAGPTAVSRVADSVEHTRRLRQQSRAGFAEVRMTSVIVPMLAAVVLAMLAGGQPAAAAFALSPLGLLLLGCCALVCTGAGVLLRRLTSD